MDPIVLRFADGTFFFVGLAAAALAVLLLLRFHNRLFRSCLTVLALLGIILVVISATPQPLWAYALWLLPVVGGLVLGNRANSPRNPRIVAGALVAAITAGFCLAEARYQHLPRMSVPNGKTVYVLGDSISAGMRKRERCWPAVLEETTGLAVVNLAQPGATAQSATKQAAGITETNSIIVVEIGGNDLLSGTEASVFRKQLDSLISLLRTGQHQVLMLELPLIPFKNAFGVAQRDLAAQYGVALLPKRFFTEVLGLKGGTLDGVHLSQVGHNALAAIIAKVLGRQKTVGSRDGPIAR